MNEAWSKARHVVGEGALPLGIMRWVNQSHQRRLIFVCPDEATLYALAAAMPVFLPGHVILPLPAWDFLPYDRARPSRETTGRRVAALALLADQHDKPTLVLTTPEALPQRVPPADRLRERAVWLAIGEPLDPTWLRTTLEAFGYVFTERVDQAGDAAIHQRAIDIYPAGEPVPVRLELDDGRIAAMRHFDPLTQRNSGDIEAIRLLPTTEAFTVPGEAEAVGSRMSERLLPDGPLSSLFDLMPEAAVGLVKESEERIGNWLALVRDSFQFALTAIRSGGVVPPPPDRLYLTEPEIEAGLARLDRTEFAIDAASDEPALLLAPAARRAALRLAEGDAVVLCTALPLETVRRGVARRLHRAEEDVQLLAAWADAEALPAGQIGVLCLPLRHGFRMPRCTVIALLDPVQGTDREADALWHLADALRIGDLVVEPERGLARLIALSMEDQAGAPCECLVLEFLGGQRLLLPAFEAGRIWRYGSAGTVKPDRLEGTAWNDRRAQAEQEIQASAVALVERMRQRNRMQAPVIEPGPAYQRFVHRMPFTAGIDQVRAIRAVRQDLAAGRPMYRLICGDVGFGKTEVALHAAALVALAGRQVAVIAPTTILARQHLDTFRRRLAGFDLTIEPLIRGSRSSEGRTVLRGLTEDRVNIVIGTHAVAAARFQDLGLVIIDEEQRFGEKQKRALHVLREGVHLLLMTATPLPRTLQAALLTLVDVSLLTQPPVPRLPVRGVVVPFDPVVVRAALLREARRGGQSFVVCPRIEDIAPMERGLRDLMPELSLTVAHGRMAGDELDKVMMAFAAGDSDVLLATNIIEAGLDLPNANTILIWRADRFGLAQLHQLRGRVGRGRARAAAYFLTNPTHPLTDAAHKRLETVAALDSLGAGFGISLADMDQRGAGDLLGEEQAGHLRLIGTELYQHVLAKALARARGEKVPDDVTPEIVLDVAAYVPADFIAAPHVRLEVYRRLARIETVAALEDTVEAFTDRFGELPAEFMALIDLTRLRLLCQTRGVAALHAGPAAVALTPSTGASSTGASSTGASSTGASSAGASSAGASSAGGPDVLLRLDGARLGNNRIILPIAEAVPTTRLQRLLAVLAC